MLARDVEQTLRGQLLLALLEQSHERADAGRCETVDNELVLERLGKVVMRPVATTSRPSWGLNDRRSAVLRQHTASRQAASSLSAK